MDGLFVDDAPAAAPASPVVNGRQKTRPKRSRPSDKRRAEGFEDGQPAGPDTAHSLREDNARDNPSTSRLSYAAGVLTCVKGTEEGLALNLIEGTYTIGRGRDNNFVLKDIAASRSHLKIEVHDNCVTVTDLKSGNGSRVNGRRIRNAVLSDGDVVEIGNTSLRFEYHGNDLSREINQPEAARSKKRNGVPADSQVRQPTQERIAEAAERLAAELSERIRHEDSFEDLATAQLASQPAAESPIGPPLDAPPPDQNGSLVEAIDNMVKDMSSPGASLQVSELWNETATHIPLSEVIPAEDPRRPHPAPAMQPAALQPAATPPPPPPQSAPVDVAPPLAPSTPYPPPLVDPPRTAAPPAKSNGLLIALMVFFFIVTVGVGGFVTWYFVWPLLDAPPTAATTQAEYANAIASAAMAIADGDLDKAEAQARKALEFAPGDAEAKTLIEKIKKMRGSDGKAAPAAGQEKDDASAKGAAGTPKAAAEAEPKKESAKPAPKKKAAPKKAAPQKVASKPAPKKAAPKPKPAPRKAAPKPKPKPRPKPVKKAEPKPRPKPKATGMTDAQAEKAMKNALRLKREDPEAACVQFKKIAKSGPAESIWVKKATTWAGRCR